MQKKQTFEEDMQRLEEIVHALEQGDISLEESMAIFEEGTKLAATLNKQLDSAEQKITSMMQDKTGDTVEKAFRTEEIIHEL